MAKVKDKMTTLINEIKELSGIELNFYGSNGLYSCSSYTSMDYLRGYHRPHEICIYLEGIIAGLRYNK